MIRTAARLAVGLLTAGILTTVSAGTEPPGWDESRFLGIEEITPGMRGIGRSVFRGGTIDTFAVEIIGVLPTASPGGEMILARLEGQGLETSGIVAGMSGSPVYLDGRIIGAVAFGWSYSKEPICGITPIAEMLKLDARAGGAVPASAAARPGGEGLSVERWQQLLTTRGEEVFSLLRPDPVAGDDFIPLPVPTTSGGLGLVAAEHLPQVLGHGFSAALPAGQGKATSSRSAASFEPGSALGVALVTGDAQVAAIGTVTWAEDDRVFAFGHRMMNLGASAYPLTTADILTVMPRVNTSFKMGVSGPVVGAVTRDYRAGIVGTLNAVPRMIPMTLTLDFNGRRETLHYELLDAELLTASLAGLISLNSMDAFNRASGPSTIRMKSTVRLTTGESVTARAFHAGFAPPLSLAGEVARLVGLIHANPFQPVGVDHIAVEAAMDDAIEVSFLQRVEALPGPYHPGDELALTLVFRDYRGDTRSVTERWVLPPALPAGRYRLTVCDGAQAAREEAERSPGTHAPQNLTQLLALLNEGDARDHLVVRLVSNTPSPVVEGRELPRLPRSLRATMASPTAGGRVSATTGTVMWERRVSLDRGAVGCQGLNITVEPPTR